MKGGSKYQPLLEYLRRSDRREVILTLSDIETLMGEPLPNSARTKKAWWSNRTKGALQADAWMGAGFLAEKVDLAAGRVTFCKPPAVYDVQRVGDTVLWNGELIKALRRHMGLSQIEFAQELGVRQQTVSDWETSVYDPRRSTSKYLTMVAEKAGFRYSTDSETDADSKE